MHKRPPNHDLAVLLEFREPTTYTSVARKLGAAHTTVARKMRELEAYFGTRLTERHGDALTLTEAGERAVEAAERIDSELAALERKIAAHDDRLAGGITLTTVDILAARYMPALASFAQNHPGIELVVDADPMVRSLSRREADVALRLTNQPEDYLSGIVLERMDFHPYRLASQAEASHRLSKLRWLDYQRNECAGRAAQWMRDHADGARPQLYVSSPMAMLEAVRQGAGAGMLPSVVADGTDGLQRLSDAPAFTLDVWLLAPFELRRTARVRALFEALRDAAGRRP